MNKRLLLSLACMAALTGAAAQTANAYFSAEEASVAYYEQGWDNEDDYLAWTYSSASGQTTWGLAQLPYFYGQGTQDPFSKIETQSKYSLAIAYSTTDKNEWATSPDIEVRPGSTVEYYVCLFAVWYFNADLKFYVTDSTTGEQTQLVSTFLWAQENAFTGPQWVKFSFPLDQFAGKTCRFAFQYVGNEGENAYIDGFRLRQKDTSQESSITIYEGGQVHFTDLSSGQPNAWQWTFEGGQPATSTEQNPVVTYPKAGAYAVTLQTDGPAGRSTTTRQAYVNVVAQPPSALIGVPRDAYLSPWVYSFVPLDTPVTFRDLSSGQPTSWYWSFEGATPATSAEQNPTVSYDKEGIYGLTLNVENAAGNSQDFLKEAIQAGGTQDVWNISPEEIDGLGAVSLGFYGYYAGTNWLGMEQFAEHFGAPLQPASISKASLYFNTTGTVSPNEPITVSICPQQADGTPGEPWATASVAAKDLAYSDTQVVATDFVFDKPVSVTGPFFVVVGPFPNNDNSQGTDDISLFCVRRDNGQPTTTWHLLADEDSHGNRTGTSHWFENIDDPISLALTVTLAYDNTTDAIATPENRPNQTTATTRWHVDGRCANSRQPATIVIERTANGDTRKHLVR